MRRASILIPAAAGLWGCVSANPVALSDDNPASLKAPAGFVDEPTAIADYKSAEELAKRAETEAKAPPSGMANMPGMSGMPGIPGMGNMTMPQGGASQGTRRQ